MRSWCGAVLVVAALAGCSKDRPQDAAGSPEDAAVKAVEKLGGKVERDDEQPGRPVVEVSLAGTQVTDADLKGLKDLKQLRHLDLSNTQVTDAGVQELEEALPNCEISR